MYGFLQKSCGIFAMRSCAEPQYIPKEGRWQDALCYWEISAPAPRRKLGALLPRVGKPPTVGGADRIRFDWDVEIGRQDGRGNAAATIFECDTENSGLLSQAMGLRCSIRNRR